MTPQKLTDVNIDRLTELFPSVVTEAIDADGNPQRNIDFDLLRQELSDHLVEGPQERYRLDWPGKRAAAFAANAPTAKTLRPISKDSVDFGTTKNLFIEGDNLEALKLLQESYLGKIKLVYMDPPYNTGNDFVYNDDFSESVESFLERSKQANEDGVRLVSNTEANGRFHSDWLSMMYPRLKLARNLLKDNGVIMISIDDNEVSNLRRICDEVFGSANFLAQFVWTTKNAARGVPPRTMLMSNHEYVVVYARASGKVKFKGLERDESEFANTDNDPRGLWRSESMKATGAQNNYFSIVDPDSGNSFYANWAFSKTRVSEMIAENLVLFPPGSAGTPRQKKFINTYVNDRKAFVTNLGWFSTENSTKSLMALFDGAKVFDFPKPIELLSFLIDQATAPNDGDIVLDLFAGSGSTAEAVMEVNSHDGGNRSFILAQLEELTPIKSSARNSGFTSIPSLSRERIRRAGIRTSERLGLSSIAIDSGFRALKVDSTNMVDVRRSPDETDQFALEDLEGSVKPDRSAEDLLFQVLLDWGLELTMPIALEQIEGSEVYLVEDGLALIACFSMQVTPGLVRAIADLASRHPDGTRVVFRDSGFASDDARINAEQVFREVSPATDIKAI